MIRVEVLKVSRMVPVGFSALFVVLRGGFCCCCCFVLGLLFFFFPPERGTSFIQLSVMQENLYGRLEEPSRS